MTRINRLLVGVLAGLVTASLLLTVDALVAMDPRGSAASRTEHVFARTLPGGNAPRAGVSGTTVD
jgi:hypothetical protein